MKSPASTSTNCSNELTSKIDEERRRRIRIALAAWAYERYDNPIIDDAEFDALARQINPAIKTGHKKLDRFFAKEFNPSTGSWIWRHPELAAVDAVLRRVWADKFERRKPRPRAPKNTGAKSAKRPASGRAGRTSKRNRSRTSA